MAQRVLKIILPKNEKTHALEILQEHEDTVFWQEESSEKNFIVSALTEAGNSEKIMDSFERNYSATEGFRLIVFPVEASIPRTDNKENNHKEEKANGEKTTEVRLRISREELYSDIVDSTRLSSTFIFMTILSTLVVAVGLETNNVAVIIGAMVIAPFLGPNVALALSTCLADKGLAINTVKTLGTGIALVIVLTIAWGIIADINPLVPEISARTQVTLQDIIVALASGCAGVLAFTTGAPATVIGVMVAVALLPPLTVFGMLFGSGNFPEAFGALLLFSANIICINLAGVTTFYFQGVTPRIWWEASKAKRAAKTAFLIWSVLLSFLLFITIPISI